MAKRNRRKTAESAAVTLPWLGLLLGAVVMLLLYVWLDSRGQALGARIKDLERQRADIRKQVDYEAWKWNALKSPANIERALERHRIVMVWPSEGRVIRLQEAAPGGGLLSGSHLARLSPGLRGEVND